MKQLTSALVELKKLGLFHRDLKMLNVMAYHGFKFSDNDLDKLGCLDHKVEIKLIDFDFVDFIIKADGSKHKTYMGTKQ